VTRVGRGLICLLLAHSVWAQDRSTTTAGPAATQPEPVREVVEADVAVRGVVIPTGFQRGKYSAMIQIAVDGSPLPDAAWDLEGSFVSQGQTQEDFSGRVVAGEPGTPVVFEVQVEFKPGPYALTLAARETTAGQSGTRKLEGRWPDPQTELGTVSPVVLLQPAAGAFVRGETARGQGALARADEDPIRTQLPTALISVVCRGANLPDLVRVERKLGSTAPVNFQTIHLLPGKDQCAQVRDMIPPGTLRAGHFRYEVHLVTKNGEIASGFREFDAVAGTQQSRGPAPGRSERGF
jgi:hypothetical protein